MIWDLQFFVRLCGDKSIRKASEALFISPQGLSKAMKNLETELGVQLFTRTNAGIVPTEAGKIVARRAKTILGEFANLKLELRGFHASAPSRLRLVVASGVINVLQPDFLHEYQIRYPEVELQVGEYPDLPGEQALLDGAAEIGFSIGPMDKRKFTFFPVHHGQLQALVNKKNPLAARKRVGFPDLAGEKWVIPNEKYKCHHSILSKCAELGVKPQISMVAAELGMVHKFCHLNHGIGIASGSGLRESGYDTVKCLSLADDSQCAWDIHLIIPKRTVLSPAARAFVEHVRSWFASE